MGNDFYALVLGPTMVYSCAYFEQPPSSGYTLEDAQRAKLDLVARKLGLAPGMRLLDVGCGWGSFVIHAAREYGVDAVGVTLSEEQAAYARAAVAGAGLAGRVRSGCRTTATCPTGRTTPSRASGWPNTSAYPLADYAAPPAQPAGSRGRLLNHAISRRPGAPGDPTGDRTSFIDRYVFPDGELHPLSTMVDVLESAGSRSATWSRCVSTTRRRCAPGWPTSSRTGTGPSALERRPGPGVAAVHGRLGPGFQSNRIGVNQVLAVRPGRAGASEFPRTRSQARRGL